MRHFTQRGSFHIIAILGVAIALVVGYAGYRLLGASHADSFSGPVVSGLSAQKCLDNYGYKLVNGNLIDLYTCNGSAAQRWTYTNNTIRMGNYCVDIPGNSQVARTEVKLWTCNGGTNQAWVKQANGALLNPSTGLCLDDKYASITNKNPIWTYACNGTEAQMWKVPTGPASQTPVPTPPAPTPPAPAPTPPATGSRDPLKWPFASTSIWNMPIGSGAQYVNAGLSAVPNNDQFAPMPQIDNDVIILDPSAPMTPVKHSSAAWSGANRCAGDSTTLTMAPIPTNFTIPNTRDNNGAAILLSDRRTILQMQPFTRCSAGGPATSLLTFPNVDIYGDGISGAHGGSRMSSLGGAIRLGELRPGQVGMKHALKVNVDSERDLYNCSRDADCFRWPSLTSDSGSTGSYGSANNNQNTAMKMGALLAIPASVNIDSMGLQSVPGKQIAWTMQNYGAYIVDSTGGPAFAIEAEIGPTGSVRQQFQSDYGMPLEQRVNNNSSWSKDIQKIVTALKVVNNNSPSSIGGGGTPRQPLAPAIKP